MTNPNIDYNKQIPQQRWVEFFDMVSDGNRGRRVKVEVDDPEAGNLEPVKDTPLMAIVCDPPGKGNDIVIETGKREVNYAHTVASPTEVWEAQEDSGKLVALKVKDASGGQTIVSFL